ncbi:type VII secretion-associated serine protease mycosin [Kitasatospora sp. NPDC093806]|uniref:type VII secretion-associated serine protease mycosin n=1 Tax=Kitasatospora sp. NPDC093806 TaxID=3155075 RepID=UPI0034424689
MQWPLKQYQADTRIWPLSQGDGVVVAVIDGGVDGNHQDLAGQVLPGADFSGGKSDGRVDADGHGTGMASLIAGVGHGNKAGISGLAPKAKILPVKIRSGGESGDLLSPQSDIASAIRFAVDHGASVVNMSVGGPGRLDAEARAAVKYAVSKDVVLVASTGNSGDSGQPVDYPAAYPGVVAVGAVDEQGRIWEKSSFGPETTVTAPGVKVGRATAKSTAGYAIGNGTSDATAYVSATAALIRAKYPELSAGQVINRIIKSATPPPGGVTVPDSHYGYGIVDPAKALDPATDSGPRENPLAGRVEAQGVPTGGVSAPPSEEVWESPPAAAPVGAGGNRGVAWVLVGAAGIGGVVVVSVVLALVVRGRRRRVAAPPQWPPYQG